MSDIEAVRYALNAADNEMAWDAFNRILTESDKLREELEGVTVELGKWRDTAELYCNNAEHWRREAESWEQQAQDRTDDALKFADERDKLREELAAAQQDAKRYRWIADNCMILNPINEIIETEGDLDAAIAIDAAMAQEKRDE